MKAREDIGTALIVAYCITGLAFYGGGIDNGDPVLLSGGGLMIITGLMTLYAQETCTAHKKILKEIRNQ